MTVIFIVAENLCVRRRAAELDLRLIHGYFSSAGFYLKEFKIGARRSFSDLGVRVCCHLGLSAMKSDLLLINSLDRTSS